MRGSKTLSAAVLMAGVIPLSPVLPILSPEPSPEQPRRCTLSMDQLWVSHCAIVAGDTAARRNPARLWGGLDCVATVRHERVGRGGDRHPTANGSPQPDRAYRRLSVLDGDDYYGERCELGNNSHLDAEPTFTLYREGDRRITFLSLRLPKRFPLRSDLWQTVFQMKQAQPSAAGGGAPIIEVQADQGRFQLIDDWRLLWSIKARRQVWIRFALDVRYSRDPHKGTIQVYVDRNGDRDAADRVEQSPVFHVQTLKTEQAGGSDDGIPPGESIPSHLRAGIYHDPAYICQRSYDCVIHVDNVQVVDPHSPATSP